VQQCKVLKAVVTNKGFNYFKTAFYPFKDEAQAALFKDPVRTAL
jgi:hypothetical protein